jgi:Icc-related predicted phosphoesterase
VTDEEFAALAAKIAAAEPVDVLLTHGCPVGLADRTPKGTHGGQSCMVEAFRPIAPRVHLCGHPHVAQEHILEDGRKVINVGATARGSVAVVEAHERVLSARLARFARRNRGVGGWRRMDMGTERSA